MSTARFPGVREMALADIKGWFQVPVHVLSAVKY